MRAELEELAAAYSAEEVIVVTVTHGHRARRRSYELLAAEFGLDAALGTGHSQQSSREITQILDRETSR